MKYEISVVVIGDELLLGRVADTNSGFIARSVEAVGGHVAHVETVGDNAEDILDAVERGMSRSDVVLLTGGLGPTKDDITKAALCRYFGGELREDAEVLANVERVMAARGRQLNDLTRQQAMVPSTCTVIQNAVGTAPLMWWERDGRALCAMPGVPFEMEHAMTHEVLPRIAARFGADRNVVRRELVVTGLSESAIAERLAAAEDAHSSTVHLAYLPSPGYVRLRVDSTRETDADAFVAEICALFPDNIAYEGTLSPAAELLERLKARGLTIATAESCTGGNIAHELTLVPGSSEAMLGGVVAYSNDVKMRLLGVEASTLAACGAVSRAVVEQMAWGVCDATGSTVGVATSGIAGPGGAVPGKPVGTVCLAVCVNDDVWSTTLHLAGNRSRVIGHATTLALLETLRLLNKPSAKAD